MANYNNFMIIDYETGGKNANLCQPMSMASVVVDPVRLTIINEGDFYSLIRANWDENWCKDNGVEVPSDEALAITKLTREDSEKAPSWQEVHTRFEAHVKKFYTKPTIWNAPLFCGFNCNYDMTIMNRACKQFGSYDKEYNKHSLFHPIHEIDVMRIFLLMTENRKGWFSISLDNIRKALGITTDSAHNSLIDCRHTAMILIKWLRWFRQVSKSVKLEDSLRDSNIADFYDNPQ